jgi:hypothetical protein
VPHKPTRSRRIAPAAAGRSGTTALRKEFRAFRESLPTQLERDTMLTPEWVAESVVQEVECFLNATVPGNFVARLAAKAYYCYDRNKHFHKVLNRRGNGGRATLYMFMRHWTAAWLKRERYALYKKLPYSFGNGHRLPVTAPGVPKHYPAAKKLVTGDCIRPTPT